jgi:hypothetical protein
MGDRLLYLLLCSCLLLLSTVSGAELSVSPGDQALAKAIDRAEEGDTLSVQPGVYRETIRIEKSLTLRALPGAVLDGATQFRAEWSTSGDGVFTTPLKKRPFGLLADGKFIAEIRYDRAKGKGDWNWQTLLSKGPPLSGFEQIRALWMYHPDEGKLYARFEGGAAPAGLSLHIVQSDAALLTVAKASGVVVEGFTFAHGSEAIVVEGGAAGTIIRHCKITSFERTGVVITGAASGCTVEDCDITRGALEEWQPSAEHSRPNYEIWRIHKEVGLYDRVGIELFRAGSDNRILRNHLDRVFDGICVGDYKCESLDKPLTDPDHGRGTEIAANVIENTRDSGIELGVGCIDVNVHHNTLRRTHGGLRFKVPRIGPVFIHHNRLMDGSPFNIWFSMDASLAEGYVYHNTINGGGSAALAFSSFNAQRDFAAPKWHFVNNLVISKEGFFEQRPKTPKPDFEASHNVVTQGLAGTDEPPGNSAAVDAGLDLSTYRAGQPLPGCEPGYFKGKAPDAGADEWK